MTLTKESWSLVIPLVEVFYSVQGEGVNVGQPAVFVRFAGCNLDCVFADGSICDTPWRKPAFKMTISHLLGRVEALISDKLKVMKGLPWVILTGGEPTAHPSFDALVIGLRDCGWKIAVETNGTHYRPGLRYIDHICVSPKNLPGITHARECDPEPHPRVLDEAHEFRYVITSRGEPCPPWIHSNAEHYVSPALISDGRGQESQERHIPDFVTGTVERCIEIVQEDPRWKISLQCHKWLCIR